MTDPFDKDRDSGGSHRVKTKATWLKKVTGVGRDTAEALALTVQKARQSLFRKEEGPGPADLSDSIAVNEESRQRIAELARNAAPVIWLLGKTGAGKTSVIATLTGLDAGEIGNGYQPCTRTASFYDFPQANPLIRFLDTRGLDEAGYDPDEDLAWHQSQAHLIMVVMRLGDPTQDNVIKAVAAARKKQPNWPLLVVHTAPHDLYPPNSDHPAPYPYDGSEGDLTRSEIPAPVRNALNYQRQLFRKIKGAQPLFVTVDFTRESDGFTPAAYGREALIEALMESAPEALRLVIDLKLREVDHENVSGRAAQINTKILYWASVASTAGALPLVGLATVPGAQLLMLTNLGKAYGVTWDRKDLATLSGMLGFAIATQGTFQFLRQVAKLSPWMIPLTAAKDYAVTYALGRAACVYLEARRKNRKANAEQVRAEFTKSLQRAFTASERKAR